MNKLRVHFSILRYRGLLLSDAGLTKSSTSSRLAGFVMPYTRSEGPRRVELRDSTEAPQWARSSSGGSASRRVVAGMEGEAPGREMERGDKKEPGRT